MDYTPQSPRLTEHSPPILETQDPQPTLHQVTRQLTIESFLNLNFPFDGGVLPSPPSSPKSCFLYRVEDKPCYPKPKLIRQDDEPCSGSAILETLDPKPTLGILEIQDTKATLSESCFTFKDTK